MEIPVVFATDENYIFYTVTAVTSMAENAAEDTFYRVYVLVSGELERGHGLFDCLQERYANLELRLLPVDGRAFEHVRIHNPHVTKATFYRLLLAGLLEEERCLYLDSDVVVGTDLQELYLTEMEGGYIAGVRDLWIDLLTKEEREARRERTHIPDLDEYVNAGVLVFDLKRIREDHVMERFCRHMAYDYPYEDQDIVNVCCYGKIRRLPAKWNLFTLFLGRVEELEARGVDGDAVRQMRERKGILHYATPFIRPWESERFLCNDVWWKYASVWSERPEYRKLQADMRQKEIGHSKEKMASFCAAHERVFVWGFTAFGREVCVGLMEAGVGNIACFLDRDAEKQKFTYCRKRVQPFDMERYEPGKHGFLIACRKSGKEVRRMLVEKGVRTEDIVCCVYKDKIYNQCLRAEYLEEGEGHG